MPPPVPPIKFKFGDFIEAAFRSPVKETTSPEHALQLRSAIEDSKSYLGDNAKNGINKLEDYASVSGISKEESIADIKKRIARSLKENTIGVATEEKLDDLADIFTSHVISESPNAIDENSISSAAKYGADALYILETGGSLAGELGPSYVHVKQIDKTALDPTAVKFKNSVSDASPESVKYLVPKTTGSFLDTPKTTEAYNAPFRFLASAATEGGAALITGGSKAGGVSNRVFSTGEVLGKNIANDALSVIKNGFDSKGLTPAKSAELYSQLTPIQRAAKDAVDIAANKTGRLASNKLEIALGVLRNLLPAGHPFRKIESFDSIKKQYETHPLYNEIDWAMLNRRAVDFNHLKSQLPAKLQKFVENINDANHFMSAFEEKTGQKFDRTSVYAGLKAKDNEASKAYNKEAVRRGYFDPETGEQIYDSSGKRKMPPRLEEFESEMNKEGISLFDEHIAIDPTLIKYDESIPAHRELFSQVENEMSKHYTDDGASHTHSAKRRSNDLPIQLKPMYVSSYESTLMHINDASARAGRDMAFLDFIGVPKERGLNPETGLPFTRKEEIQKAATRFADAKDTALSIVKRITERSPLSISSENALTDVIANSIKRRMAGNTKTTYDYAVDLLVQTLLSHPLLWLKQQGDITNTAFHTGLNNTFKGIKDLDAFKEFINTDFENMKDELSRLSESNKKGIDKTLIKAARIIGTPFRIINAITKQISGNATMYKLIEMSKNKDANFISHLNNVYGPTRAAKIISDIESLNWTMDFQAEFNRLHDKSVLASELSSPYIKAQSSNSKAINLLLGLKTYMIGRLTAAHEAITAPLLEKGFTDVDAVKYSAKNIAKMFFLIGTTAYLIDMLISKIRGNDKDRSIGEACVAIFSNAVGFPNNLLVGMSENPSMAIGQFIAPVAASPFVAVSEARRMYKWATDNKYKPKTMPGSGLMPFVPFVGQIAGVAMNRTMTTNQQKNESIARRKRRAQQLGLYY